MATLKIALFGDDNIIKSYPNSKVYEDMDKNLVVFRDDATKDEIAKFKKEVWKYWELVE
jgi:outer membrane protein assembly factor BamD (BamD/ComL family)